MRKIKIAHCMCGLDGGVGNVILNYFDNMPLDNYEVHILSNDISSELYMNNYNKRNFKVIQIPKIGKNPLKNFLKMRKIMKNNGYDIVHSHMTLTNFFPLIAAKSAKVKVRISHSHMVTNPKKSLKDRVLTIINHKFSRFFATHCMACGKEAGNSLFGKTDSFTVLNNAINLEKYSYNEHERLNQRKKLDIDDKFVIGNVGRFTLQKNHKFIVDVFYRFHQNNPDSVLLLIGEGELYEEINQKVEKLGISNSVVFTGSIDDVNSKLQAMDVFLLPSFSEGLPVVIVEAQASGLPCVVSDNVTDEVKILDNVSYISLKCNENKWIEVIEKYKEVSRKKNTFELLENAGYNICKEAVRLDNFYKKIVEI